MLREVTEDEFFAKIGPMNVHPTIEGGVNENDYEKYRGQCKPMSEAAVAADPTLRLVRGWYMCPYWGRQAHWWTVRPDGEIHDPTKLQFPSKGEGEYVEFDGMLECSSCGKEVKEEVAYIYGRHAYCNDVCFGRDVLPEEFWG